MLFRSNGIIPFYKILWLVVILIGAYGGGGKFLSTIWDMADTMNGLMAIPNLIALLWVSKELRHLVKDFDEKRRKGLL